MTVRIHIPSSDVPGSPQPEHRSRRAPGLLSLGAAGLVGLMMTALLVTSVVSDGAVPESSVPAPFEPSDPTPVARADVRPWAELVLPGDGEVLAMGTVGDSPVAVVAGVSNTLIWRRVDGAWRLEGSEELDDVGSAVVIDDRILLVGGLAGRSTVWEWIDGSARYLFQPTAGSVVGAWSVDARLVVSVAPTAPGFEQTIRFGRQDAVWVESTDGEFEELDLVGIETVLTVAGDAGVTTVGGRDAAGRAAVGFVRGDRVVAGPVPGAPPLAAVTDLAGFGDSLVARVSVANRRRGTHDEIRSAERDWGLVVRGPHLVGVEVIDDVLVAVTRDGAVVRHLLDGEELAGPPSPPWSFGFVRGLALLDGEPVAFGQSSMGSPMLVGQAIGSAEVVPPTGRWERYHSEASDGFHLFHIGSLEFALRDGELFHRSWNAERWNPAEFDEGALIFGTPRIVETTWGYVLIPPAGGGLWISSDGKSWGMVDDPDVARLEEAATDGEVLVGVTHFGALGGPTSDVSLLSRDGDVFRYSLGHQVNGLAWEEGIGFVASVVPPGSGYVTSPDGLEWTAHDGPERFDWVVAFDGALYLGTGESVIEGGPPAETPGGEGWMSFLGETAAFQDGTGAMWIHTGDGWVDVGLGEPGGLPERPDAVFVRGPRAFAMIEGEGGFAETYVLELD